MNTEDSSNRELEEMDDLLNKMRSPKPGDNMDRRFYAALDAEISKQNANHRGKGLNTWWAMAAGIALFVTGWLGGSFLPTQAPKSAQMSQLAEEVTGLKASLALTMLQQQMPGKRIQGIQMILEMEEVNDQLLASLFQTLNHDPNDNVRLMALETLATRASNPQVLEGMIQSIGEQLASPVVLLRLTEIMSTLQEKRAIPALKRALDVPGLNYNLKTQINETVEDLG